jgi:hypothetical protein
MEEWLCYKEVTKKTKTWCYFIKGQNVSKKHVQCRLKELKEYFHLPQNSSVPCQGHSSAAPWVTAVFRATFSTIFGKIKQTPHWDVSFKIGTGFLGYKMQDWNVTQDGTLCHHYIHDHCLPKPSHFYFHVVLKIYVLCLRENTQYLSFWDWLFSLNMIHSFIYFPLKKPNFILLFCWIILDCVLYYIFFIPSLIYAHQFWFHNLSFMNNAAIHRGTSYHYYVDFGYFGYTHRNDITGSFGSSIFSFFRKIYTDFQCS